MRRNGVVADHRHQKLFLVVRAGHAHRYESGSLLISSNHPFSTPHRILPDNMMAVAIVDRLVHYADIIELSRENLRKSAQAARK